MKIHYIAMCLMSLAFASARDDDLVSADGRISGAVTTGNSGPNLQGQLSVSVGDDGRPVRPFVEGKRQRMLSKIKADTNELEIESESRTANVTTKINFRFITEGVPRFELKLFGKAEDSVDMLRMRLGFFEIIEFNSTISPMMSQSRLKIGQMNKGQWSSLAGNLTASTVSGVTIRSASSTLTFPPMSPYGGLSVMLKVVISDGDATTGGVKLDPRGLKYSLGIDNWVPSYLNSKLMIVKGLWVSNDKIGFQSAANASVQLGGNFGSFDWDSTVVADGQVKPITVYPGYGLARDGPNGNGNFTADSGLKRDDDRRDGSEPKIMGFVVDWAQHLLWDPQFGFSSTASDTSSSSNSAGQVVRAGVMPSLAAVAGTLYLLF